MNLNQVTVPVSDIEKSIEFYEKLGLKLIVVDLFHYARFECPEGDATFSLHQVQGSHGESGIWLYFEVQNLDEYVQALLEKGITFEKLPNDKTWLWRESRLKDPDNNQSNVYFAGGNRKYPPWRLK